MNFKDLLFPLTAALVITWGLQYFFFSSPPEAARAEVASDKRFVAPTSLIVAEPLDVDIDFADTAPRRPKEITTLHLPKGTISFSNDGAVVEFMGFKRALDGKEELIETIVPSTNRDKGAFLLALNGLGATPYYYDLIQNKTEGERSFISYKGESKDAIVIKDFVVHHDTYTLDLKVTIEPKSEKTHKTAQAINKNSKEAAVQPQQKDTAAQLSSAVNLRPRIFFPAPRAVDEATGSIQALLYQGKHFEKKPLKDVVQLGVEHPTFIGLEDHYFLSMLIKDPQEFAQRGYFKVEGETAQGVLQSKGISEKTSWDLTFYMGPKELTPLSQVDERLEGVLDYGILAPLSKLLLALLNYFFSLLHNYGLAIIAITVLVRLLMVPFTLHQEQSKKKHLEAQKKLKYLEQRYKDDPDQLAKEKAEFAKKHGLPGLLGCLPLLLQVPVFIGLQRVLTNAIELYKAPFLWIPDLSARDPYYILPALVGVGMIFQLAQTGEPRQRLANILLAIIIAAVTANLSAGLTLFISVSTLLGLLQTALQSLWARNKSKVLYYD